MRLPIAQSILSLPLAHQVIYPTQVIEIPVLILGAGMTGLTAAHALSTGPHNLSTWLVVDALPRLGGRLQSRPFGVGGNYTIEIGANWVHGLVNERTGVTNPIWALAQAYNLSTTYSNFSDLASYDSLGPLDSDLVEKTFMRWNASFDAFLSIAGERQRNNRVDMTARAGLRLAGWQPTDYIERAVEYFNFDMSYSMSPDKASFVQAANNHKFSFHGFSDDNNLVHDSRGFSTVAIAPLLSLPPEQRGQILLNSTVTSLSYSPTGVNATLSDGTLIVSQYAICTFSLGVLQSGDIQFSPPMPSWKRDAIAGHSMSTYTKIFLQFDRKFWPDTQFQLYASPHQRGHYTQFQSLDAPGFYPGSRILFTTVTDEDSIRVESMTDAAVKEEILEVLRGMYGAAHVGIVTDFFFPRWHSSPYFRGSYSNWPAAYLKPSQDNLRAALDGRLLFAGEATSFQYFGYLQGAYEEGRRAAEGVKRCMRTGADGCLKEVWWEEVVEGRGVSKGTREGR